MITAKRISGKGISVDHLITTQLNNENIVFFVTLNNDFYILNFTDFLKDNELLYFYQILVLPISSYNGMDCLFLNNTTLFCIICHNEGMKGYVFNFIKTNNDYSVSLLNTIEYSSDFTKSPLFFKKLNEPNNLYLTYFDSNNKFLGKVINLNNFTVVDKNPLFFKNANSVNGNFSLSKYIEIYKYYNIFIQQEEIS